MDAPSELRETGLDVIGKVTWGTHFCAFYQSREDLVDTLVPYFKAGLEGGEFCMWITAHPLTEGQAAAAMRAVMPDFDRYVERGQIEILPYDEWYLAGGAFDSKRVLGGWVGRLQGAQKKGFKGLRLTGNTFWLEKDNWQDFLRYEEEVNEVIGNYPMLALCTYSLDRCRASEVIDVVNTHQFALAKRDGKWELLESAERKKAESEIYRLNSELEKKVRELETSNAELESFSYSVSHDLRSPLVSISGFGQALLEDHAAELGEEGRDYVGRMVAASKRMAQLISDLLDLSRVSREPMVVTSVDLGAMVREIAERLSSTQPERRAELVIADGVSVRGDPRLLQVALENLLENAWKFTGTRPVARIEFGSTTESGTRTCFVKDNGVGFDMTYAHKLCVPFQRLHSVGEFPGTGVGLATVKRIIQRHGGRLWLHGEPESGATAHFILP